MQQLLFYPTAIGSEPPNPTYNSYPHWARVMQGHAGANMVGGLAQTQGFFCGGGDFAEVGALQRAVYT